MAITMAQSMLKDHKEMEEICRYTKLSEAKVKELEKELKSEAV